MSDCPACCSTSLTRDGLWWSKCGMTHELCEEHKEAARAKRRQIREFERIRKAAFTVVRMDERG